MCHNLIQNKKGLGFRGVKGVRQNTCEVHNKLYLLLWLSKWDAEFFVLWFWWMAAIVVEIVCCISGLVAQHTDKWHQMIHGAVLEFWKISEPSQHHYTLCSTRIPKDPSSRSPGLSLPFHSLVWDWSSKNLTDQNSVFKFRKKGVNWPVVSSIRFHISLLSS